MKRFTTYEMNHFITYPLPPEHSDKSVPKFEVYVDYQEYSWRCEICDSDDEYDGNFMINRLTGQVSIDWNQPIPPTPYIWEAIEEELRKILIYETR